MKAKRLLTVILSLTIVLSMATVIFAACAREQEFPTWDISNGSSKLTASFTDNGNYGYVLTIEGSGAMRDYGSAKDSPWYGRSGRVTEINIAEGVTYIGDNSFPYCFAAKTIVLPSSVTALGKNVTPAQTKIYAYSKITAEDLSNVYVYSENLPTTEGNFWHKVGDTIVEWPSIEISKILFVGNSYTYYNDMPEKIFEPLAKSLGANVAVTSITKGSQRLSAWANPSDPEGAKLYAALNAANDYAMIVLQDQSTAPVADNANFLSGVKKLAAMIDTTQTNYGVYLYETWGSPQYGGNYGGIPQMEEQLRAAYEQAAAEIGATVSYVGKAFTYVWETYNLETEGSASNYWLYNNDNTHPLYIGSYLAACVHTATLLRLDPRNSTFYGSLDEATAKLMQEIAYNIVFGA